MEAINKINFCFSLYKKSVYAVNQSNKAIGTNRFPNIKYSSGLNPTPVKSAARNENAEDHHISHNKIQVNPTKSNSFFRYKKYFETIRRPIIVEIITVTKLKEPVNTSRVVKTMFFQYVCFD
jgi:hypothetical protein